MKEIRGLFLALVFTLFALSLSAQENKDLPKHNYDAGTYERVTKKGPYVTNRFFDNWFIGVGGGVNIYTGHGDTDGSSGWRFAPTMDISVGKWIVPSFGVRAQVSGFWARGWSPNQTGYTNATLNDKCVYRKSFKTMNFHGDLLLNLSNAIGGYRHDRFWSFVPYIGFGVAHSWKGDTDATHFASTVGLLNNLRLGDVVDLTLEAKHMIVKAGYDKYVGGKKFDGQFSVTAGITFKLGPKKGFKRPAYVPEADYSSYLNKISELQGNLGKAQNEIDELAKQLQAERNKPKQKEVVSVVTPVSMTVFFEIGQSHIMDRDMINIQGIAEAIKATPEHKYTVVGYADSETGSEQRNEIVSCQRAESVANALIKFGVNKDQLIVDSKGGVKEHREIELDRRVIVKIKK